MLAHSVAGVLSLIGTLAAQDVEPSEALRRAETSVAIISRSPQFAACEIFAFDGDSTRFERAALNQLVRAERGLQHLLRIVGDEQATIEGRMYALCGLEFLDRAVFETELERWQASNLPVRVARGSVVEDFAVRDLLWTDHPGRGLSSGHHAAVLIDSDVAISQARDDSELRRIERRGTAVTEAQIDRVFELAVAAESGEARFQCVRTLCGFLPWFPERLSAARELLAIEPFERDWLDLAIVEIAIAVRGIGSAGEMPPDGAVIERVPPAVEGWFPWPPRRSATEVVLLSELPDALVERISVALEAGGELPCDTFFGGGEVLDLALRHFDSENRDARECARRIAEELGRFRPSLRPRITPGMKRIGAQGYLDWVQRH